MVKQNCRVCGLSDRATRTVVCPKGVSYFVRTTFETAATLLEETDHESLEIEDEQRIDGIYYFDVLSYRWRDEVKRLSLKLFGKLQTSWFGEDPEHIRPLPKPFETSRRRMYSVLEDPSSWQDDSLTNEAIERLSKIQVTPKDAENSWRIRTLARRYYLLEDDLWAHLVTGCRISFADVTVEEIEVGSRSAMRITIYDPRHFQGEVSPLDSWITGPMWDRLGRKKRRERKAGQSAGNLIRIWTTYALQRLGGYTALQATFKWNEKFGGTGFDWGIAGEQAFSR